MHCLFLDNVLFIHVLNMTNNSQCFLLESCDFALLVVAILIYF